MARRETFEMTQDLPLMPKATAVWLVDNTTLTFRQIAEFTGMHELEIAGIADGEVAVGIKGFDPITNNQLTPQDIKRCEADPNARLTLVKSKVAPPPKRRVPRYTPVSKRQDRPAAIAWLVRYHPELEDSQIARLIGTTKPTITAIRDKSHWNYANLQPVDPVALGLCSQVELDQLVRKTAEIKAKNQEHVPTPEERLSLMPTAESLAAHESDANAPLPSHIEGFESFSLNKAGGKSEEEIDPESLFNLPKSKTGPQEEDET